MKISARDCEAPTGSPSYVSLPVGNLPTRLAELSERYIENCRQSQQIKISVPADSKDFPLLPPAARKKFLASGGQFLRFPLTMAGGHYMLRYCDNRQLREKWYKAYTAAARPDRRHDNREIAGALLQIRGEWAREHHYENYYSYAIHNNMIKNPATIDKLLDELHAPLSGGYQKIYLQLAANVRAQFKVDQMQPWDFNYYGVRGGLSTPHEGRFKNYFELTRVKKFMFAYFEKLFDLRFMPSPDKSSPDSYLIYDRRNREYLAGLHLNPPETDDHQQTPGTTNVRWKPSTGELAKLEIPEITLRFTCDPSEGTHDTLLDLSELRDLFHEMGHVIENAFTGKYCPGVPDSRRESDTNEFYSKFMENLVLDEEFLHEMSAHHKTGRKIPRRIIARRKVREEIYETRTYCSTLATCVTERELNRWPLSNPVEATLAQVNDKIYGPRPQIDKIRSMKPRRRFLFTGNLPTIIFAIIIVICWGIYWGSPFFKKFKDGKSLFRPGIGKGLREELYTQTHRRSFFDSYCAYTGQNHIELAPEHIIKEPTRPENKFMRFLREGLRQ